MKTHEEIFSILKEKFSSSILSEVVDQPVEKMIVVDPNMIDEVCFFLRDENELQFDSLMNLSGVDDANGTKVKDEDGAEIINGGTLSVFYHLESLSLKHKIVLKVSVSRDNPVVKSVSEVWRHADWQERETYDMFGFSFTNHPDLRRILMPYDWEAGYPLRKDYKNPEFYQGMKVPY
jgi:NADH-quinone oxidoreductase subunit C